MHDGILHSALLLQAMTEVEMSLGIFPAASKRLLVIASRLFETSQLIECIAELEIRRLLQGHCTREKIVVRPSYFRRLDSGVRWWQRMSERRHERSAAISVSGRTGRKPKRTTRNGKDVHPAKPGARCIKR